MSRTRQTLPWGDQSDGSYRNPILNSDFSDPDILRVGKDFYLTASDFHFVGMQILHSKDLVNWKIVNQVFHHLPMHEKYNQMQAYGQGTWAPAWGYHQNRFYIYVCTPFEGLFLWHTDNPQGQWSDMVTVKRVERWEDPCPFWDDYGQAYLIHSHKGAGPLILHKMSQDGFHLQGDGVEIYRGPTTEGPKLKKRRGYYYILCPEGGVHTGWQSVLRSKNIYGPYEKKIVLPPNSPHQGNIVELDSGQSWFIAFKSTGHLGRVTHLQPVRWGKDDWPIFGNNGQPVESWTKPDVGGSFPILPPQTSDDFDSPTLSPIWQWNHNPVNEAWSLTQRPGWLRLRALPAENLPTARNTLTQKLWGTRGSFHTRFDVSALTEGQLAGLAWMCGDEFAWVGIQCIDGQKRIAWDWGTGPTITGNIVILGSRYLNDTAILWYRTDPNARLQCVRKIIKLKFAHWKAARPALFCHGPGNGWIDIDCFRCHISK
jgi:beta-xylosidase